MEKKFKKFALTVCFIFMGILIGYSWRMYHETLHREHSVMSDYHNTLDTTHWKGMNKYSMKAMTKIK